MYHGVWSVCIMWYACIDQVLYDILQSIPWLVFIKRVSVGMCVTRFSVIVCMSVYS